MGAWGTAIFADDDAADVRDRYRELVGDGKTGVQATDILIDEWKSELNNTVFWIALAATQWRCGRLEDRVKTRAVEIIDNEADLERWKGAGSPSDLRKRRSELQHLREQLFSRQPKKTTIRKMYRSTTDWGPGELIAYQLPSAKTIVFRVIGTESDRGGTWPVCEILDWIGEVIPSFSELERLSIRQFANSYKTTSRPQLGIGRATKKEYPEKRVRRLPFKLQPAQELALPRIFTLWRLLDSTLSTCFGLQ
jgi:hypothetical protein